MNKLPQWCITNTNPSIYDFESLTIVEQTARLYGAMQQLIEEHNKNVEQLNKSMEDFETELKNNNECFKACMEKIVHDYIACLDIKFTSQNSHIDDEFEKIKIANSENISELFKIAQQGLKFKYDAIAEEITISLPNNEIISPT